MNKYGDGNTYRGTVCKNSETVTIKVDTPSTETIVVDKDTLLNVTCWDWESLKEKPDSVDWIPALRALEKLEKTVNEKFYGVKYER